jgi:hypothetical protein
MESITIRRGSWMLGTILFKIPIRAPNAGLKLKDNSNITPLKIYVSKKREILMIEANLRVKSVL